MKVWSTIANALVQDKTCAMVSVIKAEGSTPREAGARMVVTPRGTSGSIGGGTLEWHALAEAQRLLHRPRTHIIMRKSLGPDLGQCCGGRVELLIENFDASMQAEINQYAEQESRGPFDLMARVVPGLNETFGDRREHLHLWGAGHVGRALVMALAPLPFQIDWWDVRDNAFPALVPENVTCRLGGPGDMAPPGMVLIMTHSHALDFEIADFALRQNAFSFIGLIGSKSKKARFVKRLLEAGLSPDNVARLVCPIGSGSIASKEPAIIAATVAVQLLEWRELTVKHNVAPVRQLAQ